jgi:hypothetical protein
MSGGGLAEALRLSRLRRLSTEPDAGANEAAVLVARARPIVRASLRGGVLLIVESAIHDVDGRPVACHIDSFLVRLTRHPSRADGVGLALALLAAPSVGEMLGGGRRGESDSSPMELVRPYAAFWRTGLARARAVLRALTSGPAAALQPGLFDRRADREYRLRADQAQARRQQADERCALCARHLVTPPSTSRTVLVLVP